MADLGSIIDLAKAAYELGEYVSSVRQAPEEWKALEKEIAISRNVLESLQRQLQAPHSKGERLQEILQPLFAKDGPLSLLEAALMTIQTELQTSASKRKELLRALKWPFKASEIQNLLSEMQRAKGDILVTLGQTGIHLETEILEDTKMLTKFTSQAEFERTLHAISPHDFLINQQSLKKKAIPGTVRWFLDGPSFQGWAEENRAPVLLWCHGIPGAGKTVLAATAFEEIKSKHAERNAMVLIAFCLFDYGETQNAASILSAYLKQTVELRGDVSKRVQELYVKRRGRPPPDVDEICAVLAAELGNFGNVFFILDGLDEISDKSERTLLLEKLQGMVPCPKLLVTSRQLPDLSTWFYEHAREGLYRIENHNHSVELPGHLHEGCIGSASKVDTPDGNTRRMDTKNDAWKLSASYRCGNCKKLVCVYCYDAYDNCLGCRKPRTSYQWAHPSAVDIASDDVDIERAVDERIKNSPDLKRNVEQAKASGLDLRSIILSRIKADSQNTFLLLGHQMDALMEKTTPQAVLEALETLPTKMDEAHELIFDRVRCLPQDQLGTGIRNLIAMVASARRPLSLKALEHALTVKCGDTDIDGLNVPDARSLISRAFGLVVIDEKTSHVRLAHETLAHYISHRATNMPSGDRLLAEVSVAYLQLAPICNQQSGYDELQRKKKNFPFLSYASSFWASHIWSHQNEYRDRLLDLLRNERAVKTMMQLMWQDDPDWEAVYDVHGLHLAAYFGLPSVVTELARSSPTVDLLDSRATTPLMYAALKGRPRVVEALLNAGADPSRTCSRGSTALHRACQYKRIEVVRLLLQCSKNVGLEAMDEPFGKRTALAWAVHTGFEDMLRLLLSHGYTNGAQVPSDHDRNNPLVLAAATGRVGIVRSLLEDGRVPINSTDDRGDTALTVAARHGHLQVIEMLLNKGADLEVRNDRGDTVLLASLPLAPHDVAILLIKRGANISVLNNGNRGMLFKCAQHNRPNLMRFLLEVGRGLDVNVQGEHGATPLYTAVEAASLECVKILLASGARTDIRAKSGLTPVSLARERARHRMLPLLQAARLKENAVEVELPMQLVRRSTDVLENEMPMHAAVVQLNLSQLTTYLDEHLQKCLDINELDSEARRTALHITAQLGDALKARLLLERGAKVDIFDKFGLQALHTAVLHRSGPVVEELVRRGANVNQGQRDQTCATPLQLAIEKQFPKITFWLLKNGAVIDPNSQNVAWVVGAAAQFGEFEIVRQAVEAGVPFDERGEDGETPYQRACKHGHERIVRYLFEQAQKMR